MTRLHIEKLSHQFGSTAVLRDISVSVIHGEVVCLLGPSGCGKTTLLRIAAGLERLQSGKISIGDTVVADAASGLNIPPERRGIGLMFQDYSLFPHLNVRDNICFGVGASSPERQAWVDNALSLMDVKFHAESFPHALSGGQQQRVALLRALAPEPSILLLDEPFSGLDVTRRASVREETLSILKNSGVSTLMVTHDPEEAMFMADRILVMHEGRIVQDGTPVETYSKPAEPFVASLFGPINYLRGIVLNEQVATPLGKFDAMNFDEGDVVNILLRPGGISLSKAHMETSKSLNNGLGQKKLFKVISARPLGRISLVVFALPGTGEGPHLIEARIPGNFLPEPGSQVSVSINADEVFIFKAN